MSGKREEKRDQKKEGLIGMEGGSVLSGKQVARFLRIFGPNCPLWETSIFQGFVRPLGSPKKGVWMKQGCCESSQGL